MKPSVHFTIICCSFFIASTTRWSKKRKEKINVFFLLSWKSSFLDFLKVWSFIQSFHYHISNYWRKDYQRPVAVAVYKTKDIKSETTLDTAQRWQMGPSKFFEVTNSKTIHCLQFIRSNSSNLLQGDYSCILIAKLISMTS